MYQYDNDQCCYKIQTSHWRLMALYKVANDSWNYSFKLLKSKKFVNRVVPRRMDRISYKCTSMIKINDAIKSKVPIEG
ncbi:unnamed protein product [Blepharisma stoltei]|uniref:Uncharacterized protein n=1 Tax=Blepharisma stoltei TaxID=1481888 RepID=A0AAU9ILG3_9CILI|nr:unnamed protein product [Blepharisma stoltei]